MNNANVLIWDIESTNLNANFAVILCISYKWLGHKKVHSIRITDSPLFKTDPTNDRYVVEEFGKIYSEASFTVAHYGSRFDLPMINTKRVTHKMLPLPPVKLIDTWRIAKYKLKLNSNRLETLISALGLSTKKTPLSGPVWVKAMAGDRDAISYVVEHCEADVRALENVYKRISPLITETSPIIHKCANPSYWYNGYRVCDKTVYRRSQCKKCGGWFKGSPVPSSSVKEID